MGNYFVGIVYGLDINDFDDRDRGYWLRLRAKIIDNIEFKGNIINKNSLSTPYIAFAIAYDYDFLQLKENTGYIPYDMKQEKDLELTCKKYFGNYYERAKKDWQTLLDELPKISRAIIPQPKLFIIQDFD